MLLRAPVLAAVLVSGCLGSGVAASAAEPTPAPTPANSDRLLIYHVWDAPSEVAALQAVVDRFKVKAPKVTVSVLTVRRDPRNLFPILNKLVTAGRAPESVHAHAGYGSHTYLEAGLLSPIDGLWAAEGLESAVPQAIRSLSQIDGHYYSVPIGVHRMNMVWYNKPLLDKYGIDPATLTTWDLFFKAAAVLREKGVASPIAMGEAWTASIVFQDIIAGQGIEVYEDWINGKLTAPDDPKIRQALETFGRYLTYVNADHTDTTWAPALQRVIKGEAAFCLIGDWADGEFRLAGLKYGKDYGAVPAPGTKGLFGAVVDTFLRPRNVLSPTNSDRWLKLVGSREGQDAFNVLKGSIPARNDPDLTRYDGYQKSAIAELKNARAIYPGPDEAMPDAYRRAVLDVLTGFAADGDAAKATRLLAETTTKIAGKYRRTWALK